MQQITDKTPGSKRRSGPRALANKILKSFALKGHAVVNGPSPTQSSAQVTTQSELKSHEIGDSISDEPEE